MKKIIVIGGATASGKTSMAIELAQHFKTEIISADSRQCYREMKIGTAVPSNEELALVKHHFIHSHSIHEHITAGDYERFALQTLDTLFQKLDTVIVVGGTGLYLKALCEGIDEMPAIDEQINAQVQADFETHGLTWLQEEIKKHDSLFYQEGEIENPMRIMRALSFSKSNGKSILDFRKHIPKQREFAIEQYVIDIPREILYERINTRVDNMMQTGLLDEVSTLVPYKHLKNLQTVGYSELFTYLEGNSSLAFAIEKIKQHSRNYAKRQITWFKNQENYKAIQSWREVLN